MGYLSLAWGMGTIIGPFVGGTLADPCARLSQLPLLCGDSGLLRARYAATCTLVDRNGIHLLIDSLLL